MRRRTIVLGSLAGAAALTLGWWFAHSRDRLGDRTMFRAGSGQIAFNGWLKIDSNGRIVLAVPRAEMGQGIHTTLAQLAAEELDARWQDMSIEDADDLPIYRNVEILVDGVPFSPDDRGRVAQTARWAATRVAGIFGLSATGGSTSTRDAWEPVRVAGAAARNMLVQAASRRFSIPISELVTADSQVLTREGQRLASYGELVPLLANVTPPIRVEPKSPTNFRLIGRSVERLDVTAKTMGTATFGIDVRVPGMVYAAIRHGPVPGSRLRSLPEPVDSLPAGIRSIVRLPHAVAVVADSWWRAERFLARDEDNGLKPEWELPQDASRLDSPTLWARFEELGRTAKADFVRELPKQGPAAEPLPTVRRLDAVYKAPYLAHATMEPMNCTAWFNSRGGLEIWMPNQSASLVRMVAARTANIDPDRVFVRTTYLGGGFGRRAEMDLVREAVLIAREVRGTPVQLIWSREEDLRHDFYRPMALAEMSAGLDEAGRLVEFRQRLVAQSPSSQFPKRNLGLPENGQPDPNSVEIPAYRFPSYRVEAVVPDLPIPVGFWRSVGHSHTAFFEESFIDEIADATRTSPLDLRRALLTGRNRHLAVLDRVAAAANWHSPPPPGRARGIAIRASFGSIVAQVAEISIDRGQIRVHRVVCAIDCGPVINPAIVIHQMRSGIIYGMSAALFGEITFVGGRVQQDNFPSYDAVRLADAPQIDVHIVETGHDAIGGVGEPGTPPIAPAIGNAIFALTGQRLRALPFRIA